MGTPFWERISAPLALRAASEGGREHETTQTPKQEAGLSQPILVVFQTSAPFRIPLSSGAFNHPLGGKGLIWVAG